MKLVLLLERDCALRASTALTLQPHHIDTERWVIRCRTKNGASLEVPTTARVREVLRFAVHMAAADQYLVCAIGCRARTPVTMYHSAERQLVRTMESLDLKTRWRMHDLRRTAARNLYGRTKDLRLVQRLLGHRHLAYTLWYLNDPTVTITAEQLEDSNLEAAV